MTEIESEEPRTSSFLSGTRTFAGEVETNDADSLRVNPPPQVAGNGPRARLVRASTSRWWPGLLLEQAVTALMVLAICTGVVVTIVSLLRREEFGGRDLPWANQFGVLMLNVVAFLGAPVAFRRGEFIAINWIDRVAPSRYGPLLEGARDGVTLLFAIVLGHIGWQFAIGAYSQSDQYLHIPEFWLDLPLAAGAWLTVVFAVERLLLSARLRLLGVVPALVLGALVLLGQRTVFSGLTPTAAMWVMVVASILLLMLGLPLPFVFGVGAFIAMYYSGLPFTIAASDLLDGTSNFVLVAIPFFLVTGFVMSAGGLSERLARAIRVVLGRVPGGLLHVIVVSMFVFSGISGSKIGDMAAVGGSARNMAEEEGYPVPEAIATLVAGASMGDTVPPSIPLIVLSSVCSISVGQLFIGGILPAVVMGLVLVLLILWRARKWPYGRSTERLSASQKVRVLALATPVLAIPVFLVAVIVTGTATPSEASAIAVIVALVIYFAFRGSPRSLLRVASDSAVIAGVVLFITAAATLFARVLTLANVPQKLAQVVADDHLGKWGFLALSTIVLIIMGMVMEGIPAVLIFGPILLPMATSLGISPVHYGIVLVSAIGLGANSPPIGIGVFVAAQMGRVQMRDVAVRLRPYLVALYIGLIAIVFIPQITTWLPDVLHIK
ncbi:TRAP transporter large permease [Jatrophihabitans sp. DSM 45814]